jgi:Ser/Thr protein kinase RdoA (MazF antagonist)
MTEVPAETAARVGGGQELDALLESVAATYGLGGIRSYSVISVGYEDCNIDLRTDTGRFVVKVFASARESGVAARTVRLVEKAMEAGVSHPRLLRGREGALRVHHGSGNRYVVMEFVEGATFLELDRPPTDDELREVVAQAVLIHSLDMDATFVFDPWAVPNIFTLSETVRRLLDAETEALVDLVAAGVRGVESARLPHALIHGDLTKGNVLRASTGRIVVLDFAVANRFPRVQELAVVAANLMHGDPRPLRDRAQLLADLYSAHDAHDSLSPAERIVLEKYTYAAAAMEFLGAVRERFIKGNQSQETTLLLELGRAGLRMAGAELRQGR